MSGVRGLLSLLPSSPLPWTPLCGAVITEHNKLHKTKPTFLYCTSLCGWLEAFEHPRMFWYQLAQMSSPFGARGVGRDAPAGDDTPRGGTRSEGGEPPSLRELFTAQAQRSADQDQRIADLTRLVETLTRQQLQSGRERVQAPAGAASAGGATGEQEPGAHVPQGESSVGRGDGTAAVSPHHQRTGGGDSAVPAEVGPQLCRPDNRG